MLTVAPQARVEPRPPDDNVAQTAVAGSEAGPGDSLEGRVHDEIQVWRSKMRTSAEMPLRTAWGDAAAVESSVHSPTTRDYA